MNELDAILAAGRAAAAALARETVAMYRPGADDFDWSTGTTTPAASTALYTGPARVKPLSAEGREVDAGEQPLTLRRFTVSLPWAAPVPPLRPRPGDVIDVLASPDARMAGLRLWVTGADYSSTATAWRISAEERS
ncbi:MULTISPECIES: DUF6093 family protein [Streptomyces]|uniref:Uncharacterized protein n=2 Tax=Streptomyces rimosus subsp. rimosus TaxID=132474 RepID=L8EYD8_STRR1|nr:MULTISPECIES: DUF6093 family protein [Streptomyces]KOG84148.1 hypothetical protein ADK78_00670 [Kitasatospora aureofaciens]MYT44944.1 hypothetical protein [Streptomyces sp. SID5471]KUJ43429.1 hypothetical protein ADK46_00660 [Streptomyces rimosus subsp. rimosus]QDA07190.1 hypothetical protein CTZ40_29020 [Streptomyces rimosus]QEV78468.1 hypothetical protein CP984_28980 [Streptomyces rimosus]